MIKNGWGRRIRTFPHGSRARCPTTRLFPSAFQIITSGLPGSNVNHMLTIAL
jgi:hypothetical protein